MNKKNTLILFLLISVQNVSVGQEGKEESKGSATDATSTQEVAPPIEYKKATFAGGLFWYLERAFEETPGVKEAVTGYANGKKKNPYFREITEGKYEHKMAVEVTYDPTLVSYEKLLDIYWKNINPQDPKGQFIDRGRNYQAAILFTDEEQKNIAEKSRQELIEKKKFPKPIVTPIEPLVNFFAADEDYQNVYKRTPDHYARYEEYSGRITLLKEYWPEMYQVKQQEKK